MTGRRDWVRIVAGSSLLAFGAAGIVAAVVAVRTFDASHLGAGLVALIGAGVVILGLKILRPGKGIR